MNKKQRRILIERATTAFRPRDPRGELNAHPAWHDLDGEGRVALQLATERQRLLESALDPDGLSTTAHAVLARIRGA